MSVTFIYILILSSTIYLVKETIQEEEDKTNGQDRLDESDKLQDELNREYRNALCCKKKLKCCIQLPNVPNIEIRTILVRCPNQRPCAQDTTMRRRKEPICDVKEHNIKEYHGFDEDEPVWPLSLTKCRKKLMLTIKISKHRLDSKRNQYIIIDHVFDPTTGNYARILTPYVIKFKQEPTLQLYEMKFLHVVNSKVKEKVYNKRTVENFTGCDTTSAHPTCGRITYNGQVIPYSQGFCCSCDQYVNSLRQPSNLPQYGVDYINYGDPSYLLGGIECPRFVKGDDKVNEAEDLLAGKEKDVNSAANPEEFSKDYNRPWPSQLQKTKYHPLWSNTMTVNHSNPDDKNYTIKIFSSNGTDHKGKVLYRKGFKKESPSEQFKNIPVLDEEREKAMENINDKNNEELNKEIENLNALLKARKTVHTRLYRRQVQVGGTQRRGGQNCADRYTPKNVDKGKYHESAHCLRFSDVWYTVYRLQPPIVEHSLLFSIYEKHIGIDGHVAWKDITNGRQIRVTSLTQKFLEINDTFSIEYSSQVEDFDKSSFALNYKSAVLLIPEDLSLAKSANCPEVRGGPNEYLVLHASQITVDGDQCNVAGVGFKAFVNQPNRCAKRKGSCLLNQPYDLWLHDHQAEKLNLRGCFFLKYFGKIPTQPVRRMKGHSEKYLAMEYDIPHKSKINIEIRADFNTVLRRTASAKITEVYIDNGVVNKIVITVKITNSGLTSSSFMTKMTDCPLEIPAYFNNMHSKQVLIPPQHQHTFILAIDCVLPFERFHCSIEALNYKNELVALRRIRLQKQDRCVCAWHCLCYCTGSIEGIGCVPMSMQHYHAAGFQGSLPVTSYTIRYSLLDDALSLFVYIFLTLIFILLILGLGKAFIGLCCFSVIGLLGLGVILDLPKPIKRYYETELKNKKVSYDRDGWPINPNTKKRVRNIPRSTELCINVVFFFVYPFTIVILLAKRICCPNVYFETCERDDCEQLATDFQVYQNTTEQKQDSDTLFEPTISKTDESESEDVKLSTIISRQEDSESSITDETSTNAGIAEEEEITDDVTEDERELASESARAVNSSTQKPSSLEGSNVRSRTSGDEETED